MTHRNTWAISLLLTSVFFCGVWAAPAQQLPDFDKVVIKPVKVTEGIYILFGAGGNIGVSVGSDGILLVDTQYTPLYGKIMEALRKISSQPIRFVVNTHWHGDHIGGNELMAKAGTIVVAHDDVRRRLINQRTNPKADFRNPPMPDGTLPVITYSDRMTLHFNGDDIEIFHVGPAHTDGDTVVYFRKANVLHTGDLLGSGRFPVYVTDNGGTIHGMIAGLDRILTVVNADTKIIPGHGEGPTDLKTVKQQRDLLVAVRDRVLTGIQEGKSLQQIIASKPTAEFESPKMEGRTPDEFVTMVYQDLSRK